MSNRQIERPHTIRLRCSDRHGEQWFTVRVQEKTCDCPEFARRTRCDHLAAVGIHRLKPFTPTTHPTFSQALSGLVKSIRVRRIEDAVYWLVYLDSFDGAHYRFRTARRLLIGAAEDGHSIPVMEKVAEHFRRISKRQADLVELVAEAVRICKHLTWWHPDSGGHDYIYESLVGERAWSYKRWDHRISTVQAEVQGAIEAENRAMALGGVAAFRHVHETFGATKQAEFLLHLAESMGHTQAARLCRVHLSAKSALSDDCNFMCQAAWMMAGGVSSVAETILPVTEDECVDLLERARERWKEPQPIPRWCCDGLHSAGDDPRFTGLLPEMWAVCRAFQHYGRVDPSDEWLPEFECYDGLVIGERNDAGEDA
jgi:hypothetical protein